MKVDTSMWRLPKEIDVNGFKSNLQISITPNGEYLIEYINEKGMVEFKSCAMRFEQAFWRMKKIISRKK